MSNSALRVRGGSCMRITAPKVPTGGRGTGMKYGSDVLTRWRRAAKKWPISWTSKMPMIAAEKKKPSRTAKGRSSVPPDSAPAKKVVPQVATNSRT